MRVLSNLCLAVAACVALSAGSASAQSIGVSFAGDNGGGTGVQITPSQTAGVVPQANWNAGESVDGDGSLADVVDDSGAATSADVSWTSNNTWGGTGASTDDEAMVNGWLDDGADGAAVTVTDVPYQFYDVYVYGSSDAGNAGRGWTVTVNGTQLTSNGGAFADPVTDEGTFFDESNYVNGASGDPNPSYVVITGQSGDLTILGARSDVGGLDSRGAISGFQIVAGIPEPASLTLLGLGALVAAGGLRRRR